jgi:hypothetical protein
MISLLSFNFIGCHFLGIYTANLLALLSLSAKVTMSLRATAVGNFKWIPYRCNEKWVGDPWNREAKGAGRPPWPPELASLI